MIYTLNLKKKKKKKKKKNTHPLLSCLSMFEIYIFSFHLSIFCIGHGTTTFIYMIGHARDETSKTGQTVLLHVWD